MATQMKSIRRLERCLQVVMCFSLVVLLLVIIGLVSGCLSGGEDFSMSIPDDSVTRGLLVQRPTIEGTAVAGEADSCVMTSLPLPGMPVTAIDALEVFGVSSLYPQERAGGETTWGSIFANGMNQGRSPNPGPATDHRVWAKELPYTISFGPLITSSGAVLIVTNDDSVYCFGPWGELFWSRELSDSVIDVMVGPDSRIYILLYESLLSLTEAGQLVWEYRFSTGSSYDRPYGTRLMIIPGPKIAVWYYANAGGCNQYRFGFMIIDTTGRWQYTIGSLPMDRRPAIHPDGYFVYPANGHLNAVTFEGINVWGRIHNAYVSPSVTSSTGMTYTACRIYEDYHSSQVIEATDGGGNPIFYQRGFASLSLYDHPPAMGTYGHLYFVGRASDDDRPYLFSMNPMGGIRWRIVLEDEEDETSSIAIDGWETVYFTSSNGKHLRAIDGDGNPLWSVILPQFYSATRLCLSMDGSLYVSQGKNLYAFRDKLPSGSGV